MKDICSCDVADKELLALFREKIKFWKFCLTDEKEKHSIYNQLTTLFWDHAVWRTFNEARKLSIETNDPSTGLQGTIIELLDKTFFASPIMGFRRLTDPNFYQPKRQVYSLRRLIDEIKENRRLYTRENYVCYDGISFKENANDNHNIRYIRRTRQTRYDFLSGKDKDSRLRDDKISLAIFSDMENDLKRTEIVRRYANKFIAHAADRKNQQRLAEKLNQINLRTFDNCCQAIIRIGKKLGVLIDEFLLCSVPTPLFDQLKNWDKPAITTETLEPLRDYWRERSREIERWAQEAEVV